MNCIYSDPVVLNAQGELTTPTDNSLPFVFREIDCDLSGYESTHEGTLYIDATSSSSLALGLSDFFHLQSVFFLILVFVSMYFIGYTFYKR